MEHSSSCCLLARQLDHPSRPFPYRGFGCNLMRYYSWEQAYFRNCDFSSTDTSAIVIGEADHLCSNKSYIHPGYCSADILQAFETHFDYIRREDQSAIVGHHRHCNWAEVATADSVSTTQTSSTIEVVGMGSATTVRRIVSGRPSTNYKTIH